MTLPAFLRALFFIQLPFALCANLTVTPEQAEKIALHIWQNECGESCEGLTSWNQGEEFASMGIAHFIWYPQEKKGPFQEQFPEFIRYAESRGIAIPNWLKESLGCPWQSREEFLKNLYAEKMIELRYFLATTLPLQATFVTQKIEEVLPKITSQLSDLEKEHVIRMFFRIAHEPNGIYALVDYLNFKGEGICPQERYQNEGWGLLQVLREMNDDSALTSIEEFVYTAKMVLSRRVQNAPPERSEERWIKGWFKRLETYLPNQ